ncbi:Uncharacterized protein SCF082_LOCUS11934 [Durusdinium trenchii]|uniref:Uncharacterized protein n=1 Tax=Durusdinium trenchii TaxID=1381693 RepID=A0ABP0JGW5_9DINO
MARHVSEPPLVPWRLGFTSEQVQLLTQEPNLLERAQEAVGVHLLHESTEGREVLTIRGTMWQKRQAVRAMLERLFANEGTLPLLLPSVAFPALQAPELWEGLQLLGARLRLPDPAELGRRFWAVAEGNREQMLSTATRINTSLQDLADHGRLGETDFTEDMSAAPPQVLQMPQQLLHPQKLQEQTQRMLQERVQKQLEELQRRDGAPAAAGPAGPGLLKRPEVATPVATPEASTQSRSTGASAPVPGAPVPLRVLLPKKQLDFLMPDHFAAVARHCSVQLDVEMQERQVLLSGGLVEIAMAVLQLQMRAAQCPN